MAGERREATFQRLLDEGLLEIGDGYRAQNNELGGTGPIFLRAGHVTDSHIDFTGVEHFHAHLAAKVRSKMSKVGDTIVTTKGNSTGRTAFVTDRLPPFVYSPHLSYWRTREPEKLCGGFLRYWSQGAEFIEQLSGMKASTDMAPYLSLTDQRRLSITLPPLAEQKSIATVLGALDDKIELNRRTNTTLEAMARALFQSWFVDFDPVRAKLDGRQPTGLDQATSALFPEHLEDSTLGHIPKGWEVKTVGDIGDVICGKTPPTSVSDYYGDDIPFITIPDMHGNVFGAATARKLSHAGANSQVNKTLAPGSLCVSCIATPGLVVITSEDSQTNQQINSVVPHQKEETYFWYWVMTGLGSEIASSGSGGSVLVNLSKGRFETLQVIKPPHALIWAYHNTVRPLFESILANTHQSRTLATLRDTLLPKLLNGELRL